jgi:protein-S-isoprenylcysteine O-methyltransferase Ste14
MMTSGFWWILLASLVYGVVHSFLAANGVKRAADRFFGTPFTRRWYRLFFSVVGAVTLLPLLAMAALLPDAQLYAVPARWRWLTLAIQAGALVMLAAGVLQTGALRFVGIRQLFERVKDSPQPEKLIVTGLYRWMRHPLYTAALLLLWLAPVMTWNLLAINIGFTIYLLVGAYYFEEPKLIEQFGQAYEEYRRKTPMIIPWGLVRMI